MTECWVSAGPVYSKEDREREALFRSLWREDDGVLWRTVVVLSENEAGERPDSGWGGDRVKNWFPKTLIGSIAWLQGILEQVPAEYRDQALIEVDSDDIGSYEEWHVATVKVSYYRLATAEEIAFYDARVSRARASEKDMELQELARLRAKYA